MKSKIVKKDPTGKKMSREAVVAMGIKEGDKVLVVDPDTGMYRDGQKYLTYKVFDGVVRRISKNGIIADFSVDDRTAFNYLRSDGIWSYASDELDE